MIEIYTDGGCDNGNTKLGAWAFVVLKNGVLIHEESSHEMQTTNNRMEYVASINALKWVKGNLPSSEIIVFTDSDLLVKTAMQWRNKWKRNNWVRSKKNGEIKNLDLVKEIDILCESMKVRYSWIKGHSGIEWNEYVDNMCSDILKRGFAKSKKPTLQTIIHRKKKPVMARPINVQNILDQQNDKLLMS